MPVGTKTFLPQPPDAALGQITILKTASGENNSRHVQAVRDGGNDFDEGVMELCGDRSSGCAVAEVVEGLEDQRLPVHYSREVSFQFERVRILDTRLNGEFQFHRGLAFEADALPQAEQGRDRV